LSRRRKNKQKRRKVQSKETEKAKKTRTGEIERRNETERLLDIAHSLSSIEKKRKDIHKKMIERSEFIDEGNFNSIAPADIEMMFQLYDEIFLGNYFNDKHPDRIMFKLSRRMTRSGGKTEYHPNRDIYSITLSSTLLFKSFNGESRDIALCGIGCKDRLEAAMVIMEHEIIHLIEYVLFGETNCSSRRYLSLGSRIFGHTDVRHQLVTGIEVANKDYNLKVGDRVSFEFQGKIKKGVISRITKRATVMVEDPNGYYKDLSGKNYTKFYIPLGQLMKTS
jgi:hypothetical protein